MTCLPRISIVVPNFNGAATLEATLRSLIDQQYPDLEILVADGGSTDGSLEIIRRYAGRIAWWVSEKDRGQSNAINKGFAHATGEIVNWLCSDDVLLPDALRTVAGLFAANPDVDVIAGTTLEHYPHGHRPDRVWKPNPDIVEILPIDNPAGQPGCFYRRSMLRRDPPVDESYRFVMDTELWTYFKSIGARWKFIEQPLARAVQSGENQTLTGGEKITHERERLYRSYVNERVPLTFWHRRFRYPLERVRNRNDSFWFKLIYFPYQCFVILLLSPFYGFRRVRYMNWTPFA